MRKAHTTSRYMWNLVSTFQSLFFTRISALATVTSFKWHTVWTTNCVKRLHGYKYVRNISQLESWCRKDCHCAHKSDLVFQQKGLNETLRVVSGNICSCCIRSVLQHKLLDQHESWSGYILCLDRRCRWNFWGKIVKIAAVPSSLCGHIPHCYHLLA